MRRQQPIQERRAIRTTPSPRGTSSAMQASASERGTTVLRWFGSIETLRHHFARHLGTAPRAYRMTFQAGRERPGT
ncbi:hypothetical protein CFP66_35280 [Pseudonocardia sp. MH-G8]|nr:hypothetical protein CFP66_35280 [Pseudonocardia sp. MH-G8]